MTLRDSSRGPAHLFASGACIALALVAGCSRQPPALAQAAPDAPPSSLESSPSFRDFMRRVLGRGNTLEETCRADTPESVRVTLYHGLPQPSMPSDRAGEFDRAGYTVLIVADAEGAIARWHGIGELLTGYGFRTYGLQGVRLDGNGWRQVQQSLRDPRFLRIEPHATRKGKFPPDGSFSSWSIEHCREGQYRLLMRDGDPDDAGSREFRRVARTILRLAGDVYPGDADHRPRLQPRIR
jgi:hypothetical protein